MKVHPDKVLVELKQNTNTRAARNLDIVHKVCREIYNSAGPKDYSFATVGRRTQEQNGPSLNTYYSPKGARFCELVKAWATYDGADTKRPAKPVKESGDEELLVSINDLALRARIGFVIAERNRLRAEVNALKANSSIVIDQRPAAGDLRMAGNQMIQLLGPLANLLPTENEALEKGISDEWLNSHSLKRGTDGEVLDNKGRIVFPIGFLNAISKLLGSQKST